MKQTVFHKPNTNERSKKR